MKVLVSKDQKFASVDGKHVLIFVPQDASFHFFPCKSCVLGGLSDDETLLRYCHHLPCFASLRNDKKDGFWAICLNVDYQQFTKMLPVGG